MRLFHADFACAPADVFYDGPIHTHAQQMSARLDPMMGACICGPIIEVCVNVCAPKVNGLSVDHMCTVPISCG
jgi:hypothetical protein